MRLGLGLLLLTISSTIFHCKPRNLQSIVRSDANSGSVQAGNRGGDPMWQKWFDEFQEYAKVPREGGVDKALDYGAQVGRFMWYFATAGNAKYHSTILPQKVGFRADYYDVFKSSRRGRNRFAKWGLISDPSCVPAQEAGIETYGFDLCPGDLGPKGLLAAVGDPDSWSGFSEHKEGYWKNDPACDILKDCRLHMGTSTGAVGFRKFPNPRFNKAKWNMIGGWQGFQATANKGTHLGDDSIEPPFLIGHACGSCHVSFNPEKPPQNPENPAWANIKGAVGAQYLHVSEILGSGMPRDSLEWQIFTHARPGTADTSGVTHDSVNNPGSMNKIINFSARPGFVNLFPEALGTLNDQNDLNLSPHAHNYKYFDYWDGPNSPPSWAESGDPWPAMGSKVPEVIPHILKGGEDTTGAAAAVQRVYVNIGLCAESCMINHLQDLKSLTGRLSRQTPLRTDQCMRDCPEYRSVAKKTLNVAKFLISQPPAELYRAKGFASRDQMIESLGKDKVELGLKLYATHCTKCHSSRISPNHVEQGDIVQRFMAKTDDLGEPNPNYLFAVKDGIRLDWLGNDDLTSQTDVGTNKCRSLHSNHMNSHLWEQYGSDNLRKKPKVSRIPELNESMVGGDSGTDGRGYYRNPSLLSVWAFAPFMHNNALGMELCNYTRDGDLTTVPDSWKYGDSQGPSGGKGCMDPAQAVSVEGRLEMFETSLRALFNPSFRKNKITRTDQTIRFPIGPTVDLPFLGKRGLALPIPKNVSVSLMGSIDHRKMVKRMIEKAGEEGLYEYLKSFPKNGEQFEKLFMEENYVNCNSKNLSGTYEDQGHNFLVFKAGAPDDIADTELNEKEMEALIEFMKTL